MTFMLWSDDYSVRIGEIDGQHKWLFDATNRLHDETIKEVHSCQVIGEIIEGLMEYTMNHFIMEEELFQRYGYPQAQVHKAQHDKFTATIMHTLTDFESGAVVEAEVLDTLKNWLVQHILKTDTAYVPFLKEKDGQRFAACSA
ncbi:MAG: bacteriohemerythrin [Polaromonas sp.]|nr:bacteriohemerythrin [Polaromonas sp.]